MTDRLSAACIRGLEREVKLWFAAAGKLPGAGNFFTAPSLEVPVIGGFPFAAGHAPASLMLQVCRALVARENFHLEKPSWAHNVDLPLRHEDIEALENGDDNQLRLVGIFGSSLRLEGWDPRHPSFAPFCCGLLADLAAPDELRNDASLLQEFPPQPIDGICGGYLGWRSPEMLAADRQNAQNAHRLMGA
jgi:hypothetical protein